MNTVSRRVDSPQRQRHPDLVRQVQRQAANPFRRPIADHNRRAFETLAGHPARHRGGLILDAGCGTGASTALLAQAFPKAFVVGVDRSAARLAKAPALPSNAVLVRADLEDIWRLLAEAGWHAERQYLLYPNPWPKPGQLTHRWHAHPVFPALRAVGGLIELRSNWSIYVEEFAAAAELARAPQPRKALAPTPDDPGSAMHHRLNRAARTVERYRPKRYLSPFEAKYHRSGQTLYRWRAHLSS